MASFNKLANLHDMFFKRAVGAPAAMAAKPAGSASRKLFKAPVLDRPIPPPAAKAAPGGEYAEYRKNNPGTPTPEPAPGSEYAEYRKNNPGTP